MEGKERAAIHEVAEMIAEDADEIRELFDEDSFRAEFEEWRNRNPQLMKMVHEAEERLEAEEVERCGKTETAE